MRTRAGRFILKAMYTERVFGMHLFSNEYKPEVFWFRDIIPITVPATRGIPARHGQPMLEQGNLTGM
jgi:hypothetical protein